MDNRKFDKILDKFFGRLALEIQKEITKNYLPFKGYSTGRLINSISVTKEREKWLVGSNLDEAVYLEMGTGIYGPKKRKITPTKKKALHWWDKLLKKDIFAKSVKGIEPKWAFHRAVAKSKELAQKVIKEMEYNI